MGTPFDRFWRFVYTDDMKAQKSKRTHDIQYTFRVRPETLEVMRAIAWEHDISVTQLIRHSITHYLKLLTREGLRVPLYTKGGVPVMTDDDERGKDS